MKLPTALQRGAHDPAPNATTTRVLLASESQPSKPWLWPIPILDGAIPSVRAISGPAQDGSIVEVRYQDIISPRSMVPVLAVQDGIVIYAARTKGGAMLCLDHSGGWSTQYEKLDGLSVLPTDRFRHRRCERVQAGNVIGYLRHSPLQMHFALSQLTETGLVAVDAIQHMRAWSALPWFDSTPRARKRLAA